MNKTIFDLATDTVAHIQAAPIVVGKAFHGWTATTTVKTPDGRALQIVTLKRSSGALSTTVTSGLFKAAASPGGFESFAYAPFSDYNVCPRAVSGVRVTSKAVAEQHGKVLADLQVYIDAAMKHHAKETA